MQMTVIRSTQITSFLLFHPESIDNFEWSKLADIQVDKGFRFRENVLQCML